ncbi:Lactonase, 7-bladed beta-propeller-domain-containing protein [Gymnopilus junonius]|uniref:Lactonase, 7-bladed beta-propeller-domain-containing protein n=1 Tax=Gymnopilus junonius TaxID=109634 RepID=A0A9P5P0R2_GYMJU|nr:Lactonase, 7-bladed beta-propeller-domain-containing protein [Gymnopilus junonius]
MVYHILVASYSNEIVTLTFDPTVPSLEVTSKLTVGHHPSWIASSPGYPELVFTGLEQADGKILTLGKDSEGRLHKIAEVSSAGSDPCHLVVVKNELVIANYSSGTVGFLPIHRDPKLASAMTPASIQLSGTGPNTSRQESSHPHQVVFNEEYQELFVADLGADKVLRLSKTEDGAWKVIGEIDYEPGGGPRHLAFHNGDMFTLLELSSKLTRHRVPRLPRQPTFVTSTPTMSQPLPQPNEMLAAEILISPATTSFPTPYIYLSNRDDPSPEGDIISIFSFGAGLKERERDGGKLELVNEVRTGLRHLRGIVFSGPEGRYLIAGGANGGGVKIFERTDGGKGLRFVVGNESIEAPTGFSWL